MSEDYSKVLLQMQNWMSSIVRWNAIFLLPPSVYFDEAMDRRMILLENCLCLKGTWIFKPQAISSYVHDICHGGQRQCGVLAVRDIVIIM